MTAAEQTPGLELPPAGDATPDDRPLTLSEEHGLLLRQVAVRAEELLAVTADGGWPAQELQALLTYMRVEVLRQAVDEERLLFPSYARSAALERLGRDHTVLHLLTETLATSATADARVPADLAATTRELLAHLERHLGNEEAVLATQGPRGQAPGTTVLTHRPHAWFGLSEGGGMDLDGLPAAQVVNAVADRLLRLSPGERFELRSSTDPYAIWQRMNRIRPGDYGFDYLQDGPDRWRVQVTRRPAPA
ncbi:MAG TPA: hemerythrin domain-containing protein [Mycobacteriales bacterium]|nr:hemerythrin domain-containing protein [Mycobacteriales bacterium]